MNLQVSAHVQGYEFPFVRIYRDGEPTMWEFSIPRDIACSPARTAVYSRQAIAFARMKIESHEAWVAAPRY